MITPEDPDDGEVVLEDTLLVSAPPSDSVPGDPPKSYSTLRGFAADSEGPEGYQQPEVDRTDPRSKEDQRMTLEKNCLETEEDQPQPGEEFNGVPSIQHQGTPGVPFGQGDGGGRVPVQGPPPNADSKQPPRCQGLRWSSRTKGKYTLRRRVQPPEHYSKLGSSFN